MRAQKPAQGIMQQWPNSYLISCECTSPDHEVLAWVDTRPDGETREVVLEFYVEGTTPWWNTGFNRVRAAWNMLVRGFHQESHVLILREQAATNLIAALQSSIRDIKNESSKKGSKPV